MATNSYIQRNYDTITSTTGKRLMLSINSIQRDKGVNTTDLPIPSKSSATRQLLPLSGQVNNFTINASLLNEGSNVGYSIASGGGTSSDSITTLKQQYTYIYDTLLGSGITSKYTLYVDWLNTTYVGHITIDSTVERDSFENEVEITINFKEGTNFLGTS